MSLEREETDTNRKKKSAVCLGLSDVLSTLPHPLYFSIEEGFPPPQFANFSNFPCATPANPKCLTVLGIKSGRGKIIANIPTTR